MHPLIERITPKSKAQRMGVFVAIALTFLVLFLHNPFDGYSNFMGWDYYLFTIDLTDSPSSIWDLQSSNPIVYWFRPISHLASAIISIWVLCLSWLYLSAGEA